MLESIEAILMTDQRLFTEQGKKNKIYILASKGTNAIALLTDIWKIFM